MGKGLDQILSEGGEGTKVTVTVVTNQDNLIASYARGTLIYHPPALVGPIFRGPRLSTSGGESLMYYFSDRMLNIDRPPNPGEFERTPRQPFSANATDELGLSVSSGGFVGSSGGTTVAKFTLRSWGNATFSVPMESRGNLLVGIGPPIGNLTDHAVYVISFSPDTFVPPR